MLPIDQEPRARQMAHIHTYTHYFLLPPVSTITGSAVREGKGARRAQIGAASSPGGDFDGLDEEEGEAHSGKAAEADKGNLDHDGV